MGGLCAAHLVVLEGIGQPPPGQCVGLWPVAPLAGGWARPLTVVEGRLAAGWPRSYRGDDGSVRGYDGPIQGPWTLRTNNGNGLQSSWQDPRLSPAKTAGRPGTQPLCSTASYGSFARGLCGRTCRGDTRHAARAIGDSSNGFGRVH